jgi:hypothetical protein
VGLACSGRVSNPASTCAQPVVPPAPDGGAAADDAAAAGQ